jgi:hypothetical protein
MANRCDGLLLVNLVLAGIFVVAPWAGVFIGDVARDARGGPWGSLVLLGVGFGEALAVAGLLFVACELVAFALRLYSRTRGWNLQRRVAWNIVCHASIGWVLMGLLPLLFLAAWYTVGTLLRVSVNGTVPGRAPGMQVSWDSVIGPGAAVTGLLLGAAIFAHCLLAGARACKFAAGAKST